MMRKMKKIKLNHYLTIHNRIKLLKRLLEIFKNELWFNKSQIYWLKYVLQLIFVCVEKEELFLNEKSLFKKKINLLTKKHSNKGNIINNSSIDDDDDEQSKDKQLKNGDNSNNEKNDKNENRYNNYNHSHKKTNNNNKINNNNINVKKKKDHSILKCLFKLMIICDKYAEFLWSNTYLEILEKILIKKNEKQKFLNFLIANIDSNYFLNKKSKSRIYIPILKGFFCSKGLIKISPKIFSMISERSGIYYLPLVILEKFQLKKTGMLSTALTIKKNEENEIRNFQLYKLYKKLGEKDYIFGLWDQVSSNLETKIGLSLEQQGFWQEAQKKFWISMEKIRVRQINTDVGKIEYGICENQWVDCALKLGQTDILIEFSREITNFDLFVNCLWKNGDWDKIKESLEKNRKQTIKKLLIRGYLAIQQIQSEVKKKKKFNYWESKPKINKIYHSGLQNILIEWNYLPKRIGQPHLEYLIKFQQFLELHESFHLIAEIEYLKKNSQKKHYNNNSSSGSGIINKNVHGQNIINNDNESNNFKINNNYNFSIIMDILDSWKQRLPNYWEELPIWQDLLEWRLIMFNLITDNLKELKIEKNIKFIGEHQKAFTLNRYAKVARKHGLISTCLTSIDRVLKLSNLTAEQAFKRFEEQTKCYMSMEGKISDGLNKLKNLELKHFPSPTHQSLYLRLKGEILTLIGEFSLANKAFYDSIRITKKLGQNWGKWARFCDLIYSKTGNENWAKKAIEFYYETSLLNGDRLNSLAPRIIWLFIKGIGNDNPLQSTKNDLKKNIFKNSNLIMWIPWVNQILNELNLNANENFNQFKYLIKQISKKFPQSIYYYFQLVFENNIKRKKMNNEKNVNKKKDMDIEENNTMKKNKHNDNELFNELNEIFNNNSQLIEVNQFKNLILKKFIPNKDLLKYRKLNQLLINFYCDELAPNEINYLNTEFNFNNEFKNYKKKLKIIQQLKNLIKKLNEKILSQNLIDNLEKHLEFNLDPLNIDLFDEENVDQTNYNSKIENGNEKESDEKNKINEKGKENGNGNGNGNGNMFVEKISKIFFPEENVEMPGQYLEFNKSKIKFSYTDHVKIHRIFPEIYTIFTWLACQKKIKLIGDDGKKYYFLIDKIKDPKSARSEERFAFFLRLTNRLFKRHTQTKKRNINCYVPLIVPLSNKIRLISEEQKKMSLEQIYEIFCDCYSFSNAKTQLSIHQPLDLYLKLTNKYKNGGNDQKNEKMYNNIQIFNKIKKEFFPENMLYNYAFKLFGTFEDFWLFKKQFSLKYSSYCFWEYVLNVRNSSVFNISFAPCSGEIRQFEFYPNYDYKNLIGNNNDQIFKKIGNNNDDDENEKIPFRLSPNIQHLVTKIGIAGLFRTVITSSAQALINPKFDVQNYLNVFIREDLSQLIKKGLETNTEIIVENIYSKIENNAPKFSNTEPVNIEAQRLIERAQNLTLVANLSPKLFPWF
ncbi:hypothetical protein M0813_19537 [Anaeramoeba flamelloides]|uniref:Non-specific serine/threonine protein kinase n=1 Tax=Anaeramoeba flamelloides TaxID=1746091 RepID=A0ABQ8YNI8_9EUKA|nr:hypothetical protein M0813_19537 [Anaeramoeba flamelloides]